LRCSARTPTSSGLPLPAAGVLRVNQVEQ
jgi:hypothetical protein